MNNTQDDLRMRVKRDFRYLTRNLENYLIGCEAGEAILYEEVLKGLRKLERCLGLEAEE